MLAENGELSAMPRLWWAGFWTRCTAATALFQLAKEPADFAPVGEYQSRVRGMAEINLGCPSGDAQNKVRAGLRGLAWRISREWRKTPGPRRES